MKRLSALVGNGKLFSECRFPLFTDHIIKHITFDSRSTLPNSLFVALKGTHSDGHRFVEEAIINGAVAIIHSENLTQYHREIAYLKTESPRKALSALTAIFWDNPEKQLNIIGVTGTDGKTTTCEFLWQLLSKNNIKCGLLDTVAIDDGSGRVLSPYRQSTPEVTDLYPFLARCVQNKVEVVILESTSHGLSDEFSRMSDIEFSGAVFTTFTSEHLEFHESLARYLDAKMNLVRQLKSDGFIIAPSSFQHLDRIIELMPSQASLFTYSLDEHHLESDVVASSVRVSLTDRQLFIVSDNSFMETSFAYGPSVYASNALGAVLACSRIIGVHALTVAQNLLSIKPIEGRFNLLKTELPFSIIVDFAHTADAFAKLFSHVHNFFTKEHTVALFGAAGDRDRSKRAPMGFQASLYCQALFLTDEDPRCESSQAIFDDITSGIPENSLTRVFEIPDRSAAIANALNYCKQGDLLLVLGKGHETSIQYGDYSIPWHDEKEVLRQADTMGHKEEL
ncbi:MAG: UDP-N-acetylmuramyl-tripeptide synthetase [Sphaerochaetaceae bacterium]|nr:UDP-N-acetylmuramyl-tripeptide synthetase [Sphaerochaetaceae bacterium]NLO59822.1 UDP-N-acetylmuramyl-tripeptide synthetase [Spirochaetales bacterium]